MASLVEKGVQAGATAAGGPVGGFLAGFGTNVMKGGTALDALSGGFTGAIPGVGQEKGLADFGKRFSSNLGADTTAGKLALAGSAAGSLPPGPVSIPAPMPKASDDAILLSVLRGEGINI